ncbi:hypothetical protein FRB98_003090 [Tulasnella sp. 332]|nr:hypothetical protein FRB98_003090 [Tulasnella sp. 332]
MSSALDGIKGYLSGILAIFIMVFWRPIAPLALPKSIESMDFHKKRVLITGANGGVGKALAFFYASHGAEVFMLCRSEERANAAKADIQATTINDNVFVEVVDQASFDSVRAFLDKWAKRSAYERRIDILHNNAGGIHAKRNTTQDGFEYTYISNFLSSFLLTTSLLNMGAFASDARIVQTSSAAAYSLIYPNPLHLSSEDILSAKQEGEKLSLATSSLLYGRAKGLQIVWTSILQEKLGRTERYKDVVVQSCHPGWVETGFWKDPLGVAAHPYLAKFCQCIGMVISATPEQGAVTPIFLATSSKASELDNRGRFWDGFSWRWTPGWVVDERMRARLWKQWQVDADVQADF